MEKRISQETFDAAVNENIEEFDMTLTEAISDAAKQFRGQGVDLSNIDTSGGIGKEEVIAAITSIKALLAPSSDLEAINEAAMQGFAALSSLCDDKHILSTRNQGLVLSQGCYNALHSILEGAQNGSITLAALQLLSVLCKNNIEIRDFFEPGGNAKLCALLLKSLEGSSLEDRTLTTNILKLAKIVAKSENNKVMLMKHGVGPALVDILTRSDLSQPGVAVVVREACQLVRELSVHDDGRKEMSCAYENGRFFVGNVEFCAALMRVSASFEAYPAVASAALLASRSIIATDEAVRVMAQHGAIGLPAAIMTHPNSTAALVKSALGLARNLCGDDARKDRLVADGTLSLILRALSNEAFVQDAGLVEHGLACLAAMSLRSPSNSTRMMQLGVAVVLTKCMRVHKTRSALLRQGCLTIRNIAARCPDLRETLLDASVEGVLRESGRFRDVVDEAYAALRDLGCDVKVIQVDTSGNVEEAFQQFGVGPKAVFNPVFEETVDIISRVAKEARAPFARDGPRDEDSDEDDDNIPEPRAEVPPSDHQHEHEHEHEHSHDHGHSHEHDRHEHTDACCVPPAPPSTADHEHAHSHVAEDSCCSGSH